MVIKNKTQVFTGPVDVKPYRAKKDEEYMGGEQLKHFEHILHLWKEQLMEERSRTVQDMQTDAANYPDPVDRAYQEERFNLELKARDRERKLLKRINDALERIKGGDYGFCADCGADIGLKRLEARPIAMKCIECKTVDEIREKQIGG
ncbi:MAG: RNA polymerase-binding protein DksA [Gammaproteobacteria bacterium]|nr:RNA polymerase-binding protein DksA [Gammaproteobacteria bacterium]